MTARMRPHDGGDGQERWRNPEEPDVEPPRPKFETKNLVGPRIDTTLTWSPLSLFKLFFSSSAIHTIVNNTNEWSKSIQEQTYGEESGPTTCMTRDRFEAIFWYLQLSDVKEDEENHHNMTGSSRSNPSKARSSLLATLSSSLKREGNKY